MGPFGLNCRGVPCGLGFPDQYTKVDAFLDWIQRYTGINAV